MKTKTFYKTNGSIGNHSRARGGFWLAVAACAMPVAVAAVEPDALLTEQQPLVPEQAQASSPAVVANASSEVMLELGEQASLPVKSSSGSQLILESKSSSVERQVENAAAKLPQISELDIAEEEREEALSVAVYAADYAVAQDTDVGVNAEPARAMPAGTGDVLARGVGEVDTNSRIPYALVLALFALIGLVPVSRRSH